MRAHAVEPVRKSEIQTHAESTAILLSNIVLKTRRREFPIDVEETIFKKKKKKTAQDRVFHSRVNRQSLHRMLHLHSNTVTMNRIGLNSLNHGPAGETRKIRSRFDRRTEDKYRYTTRRRLITPSQLFYLIFATKVYL